MLSEIKEPNEIDFNIPELKAKHLPYGSSGNPLIHDFWKKYDEKRHDCQDDYFFQAMMGMYNFGAVKVVGDYQVALSKAEKDALLAIFEAGVQHGLECLS